MKVKSKKSIFLTTEDIKRVFEEYFKEYDDYCEYDIQTIWFSPETDNAQKCSIEITMIYDNDFVM